MAASFAGWRRSSSRSSSSQDRSRNRQNPPELNNRPGVWKPAIGSTGGDVTIQQQGDHPPGGPAAMKGWGLVLRLVAVAVSTARAATITQHTEGWCSPAVGVRPKAMSPLPATGSIPRPCSGSTSSSIKKTLNCRNRFARRRTGPISITSSRSASRKRARMINWRVKPTRC